ncbi:peptide ABC transporter permease [Anaerocolumna cellulosilytica]|uniref:Peptide ABC transporter permease n=1 Tax=Anaerocolumna cellulosilytica TaxID=433286 RepID=A0A6S6QVW0_9FIRM|nr:ABC transporter permease [Anaerocolumna cellulosilytica]MBB5195593.1 peptide/nickel transport system permease protein [Anaerocolumna cellulosilytica]BCJ93836.1 peptide ABC transporter permease [Anaerocolumna cellulosilytica]
MKYLKIKNKINRRIKTIVLACVIASLLVIISLAGIFMNPELYAPNYSAKKLLPSFIHPFGTDYLGRDMFFRSIKGLSTSILIGTLAGAVSACMALALGLLAATAGSLLDKVVSYFVDLFMGIPHIVLLMLISFMLGGGLKGVIIGIALTHWPNLTRVIRGEVMQVRNAQYVKTSRKFGTSKLRVALRHIVPHVLPQFIIGLILLFPHAILHEAGLTFLGFGLPIDAPAIGNILSEALKHIATGMWWLVLFPGAMLVIVVMLFDKLGEYLRLLLDPGSAQE